MKADVARWSANFKGLVKQVDVLKAEAADAVKLLSDKNVATLDERWAMFLILADALPVGGWASDFQADAFGKYVDLNDLLWCERHQIRYFGDIWSDQVLQDEVKEGNFTQEQLDEWREAVIRGGKSGFTYDW